PAAPLAPALPAAPAAPPVPGGCRGSTVMICIPASPPYEPGVPPPGVLPLPGPPGMEPPPPAEKAPLDPDPGGADDGEQPERKTPEINAPKALRARIEAQVRPRRRSNTANLPRGLPHVVRARSTSPCVSREEGNLLFLPAPLAQLAKMTRCADGSR